MAKTITINGVHYDSQTGLRVSRDDTKHASTDTNQPAKTTRHAASHATSVHATTQRSQRLHRKYTKKSHTQKHVTEQQHQTVQSTTHVIHKRTTRAAPATVTPRNPHVRKFADISAPRQKSNQNRVVAQDIAPRQHPVAARAQRRHQAQTQHTAPKVQSSAEIKKQVIHKALHAAQPQAEPKVPLSKRLARRTSMASGALALVLLAGYFTYISIPSISVRVAAVQTGVDASYPGYQPDGYSFSSLNTNNGSVQLSFGANAGPQGYVLQQRESSWDSTALLENHIQPQAGTEYTAYNDSGLTIYTFDGNAAWVNGGILHVITAGSNTQLSDEQIRKIATSL